jgi:hypothetical protein
MLFQFQVLKKPNKNYQIPNIKRPPHRIIARLSDQTQYQMPSPPNIVRLSDDKQVIFVEWPYTRNLAKLWLPMLSIW